MIENQSQPHAPVQPKLYRIDDLERVFGLKRSSVYTLLHADPSFPKPIQLTRRAVAWRREEVERWVDERPRVRIGAGAST